MMPRCRRRYRGRITSGLGPCGARKHWPGCGQTRARRKEAPATGQARVMRGRRNAWRDGPYRRATTACDAVTAAVTRLTAAPALPIIRAADRIMTPPPPAAPIFSTFFAAGFTWNLGLGMSHILI